MRGCLRGGAASAAAGDGGLFIASTTLGVLVAALGIRVLEMFLDPNAFASLPLLHQRLFRKTDVLMTGAVLGGGSDALHQMVLVFTNFFERAKGR